MARKGALHIALTHETSPSLPESLANLPLTSSSCHPQINHFFYFHLFSFSLSRHTLSLCPLLFCVSCPHIDPLYLSGEKQRKKRGKNRDILLASKRKPETGRGSEQCQQIREVLKPLQEACQSSSITRASEKQKNMRTANRAGMSSLRAKSSQTASDKTKEMCCSILGIHL